MNKDIMRSSGFNKEVDLVEQNKCPFCGKQLKGIPSEFKDVKSFREYKISGLCQQCQNNIFE